MLQFVIIIIITMQAWKLDKRVVSSKPLLEGGIGSFFRLDINKQISPTHAKKIALF